jgi:hypothetical protein
MQFARMTDEDHKPNEAEIRAVIGSDNLWTGLKAYLDRHYDFLPELVFYGRKYGWTIRYRKGGKTLVSLFPEHGAFTALIVLGKKEGEKAADILADLSTSTKELVENTRQLHDGKWLWIRVCEPGQAEDVRRLLSVKHRPKTKGN